MSFLKGIWGGNAKKKEEYTPPSIEVAPRTSLSSPSHGTASSAASSPSTVTFSPPPPVQEVEEESSLFTGLEVSGADETPSSFGFLNDDDESEDENDATQEESSQRSSGSFEAAKGIVFLFV